MTEQPPSRTGDVLLRLAARLRENQVYGPPVQRDGVTVVPAAHVRAGGGLGGAAHRGPHETNGGFGFVGALALAAAAMPRISPGTAVCVCGVSPLGHSIAPGFLHARSPGRSRVRPRRPS